MRRVYLVELIAILLTVHSGSARAETPEQQLVRISKKLHPISDSQWNEIAGSRTSEVYDVQRGDTLWDISKRLFGNSFYWPKVWSLNNSTGLTNPHQINPGKKLAFLPGSSESTPRLATVNEAAAASDGASFSATSGAPSDSSGGSMSASSTGSSPEQNSGNDEFGGPHEYDKLPPEKWAPEKRSETALNQYDENGLEKDMKITIPKRFSFRVPAIANDATVPFLGEVVASRRDGVAMSQGETVFLKSATQDLQVGTTYSVLGDPDFVREKKSDRSGYIYKAIGEIRIVGVKDELYIGVITKSYDVIERGDRLYPLLPLIEDIKVVPARNAIESLVVTSRENQSTNSSQFQIVHFDRGIEDGVQVGNVFRLFDYYDPLTKLKITDSDFLVSSDAIIVHATSQFSTGLILRSRDTISRGDFGVLLTDTSDLEKQISQREHDLNIDQGISEEDQELDELDQLDRSAGEGLGRKEESEIKELEQWDKSKDQKDSNELDQPSDAPTSTDATEATPGDDANPLESPEADPNAPDLKSTEDQSLDSQSEAKAAPEGTGTETHPATEPEGETQAIDGAKPTTKGKAEPEPETEARPDQTLDTTPPPPPPPIGQEEPDAAIPDLPAAGNEENTNTLAPGAKVKQSTRDTNIEPVELPPQENAELTPMN